MPSFPLHQPASRYKSQSTRLQCQWRPESTSGRRGGKPHGPNSNCDSGKHHDDGTSRPAIRRRQQPRVYLSNVRNLRYTIDELATVLKTNQIDIGCVTESWHHENTATESLSIG
jgi:hypothetical protein